MKILFAVSNDNITTSVVNKYQQKYKEIITSKNVYYFNAIIKELQRDKSYDAIVIGEDLEPISNNNYEAVDKFLFEKLDGISDEASKPTGEDIPIILICSDRRTKSDQLLIKLFGIGIYNAIIGNDRSIDTVCNLINKPRNKKEAKLYYKVESEDVTPYEKENDQDVSETEIQNILSHYRKIGTNEKKCVESFDSIADQYNDTQLRVIVNFLPEDIKKILESNSSRYQKLINKGTVLTNGTYAPYNKQNPKIPGRIDVLTKDLEKTQLSKPVIIPSTININKESVSQRPMNNQASVNPMNQNMQMQQANQNMQMQQANQNMQAPNIANNQNINNLQMNQTPTSTMQNQQVQNRAQTINQMQGVNKVEMQTIDNNENNFNELNQASNVEQRRGRGRPKKVQVSTSVVPTSTMPPMTTPENTAVVPSANPLVDPQVRRRGRPPKRTVVPTPVTTNPMQQGNNTMPVNPVNNEQPQNNMQPTNDVKPENSQAFDDVLPGLEEPVDLFGISPVENNDNNNNNNDTFLPGFENDIENMNVGLENDDSDTNLFDLDLEENTDSVGQPQNVTNQNNNQMPQTNNQSAAINEPLNTNQDIYNPMESTNQDMYNPMGSTNQDIYNPMGSTNQDIYNPMGSTNQDMYNPMGSTNQDMYNPMGNANQDMYNPMGSTNQDMYNPMGNANQDMYNPMGNANQDMYNPMGNANQDMYNPMGNVNQDMYNQMGNVNPNMNNSQPNYNQGIEQNPYSMGQNSLTNMQNSQPISSNNLAGNGKVALFVGTTKNGTSFIVNNLAQLLSQNGVRTAVLDLTKNKNSYYMFTDNNSSLMKKAADSIKNLSRGVVDGLEVNRNLTVFTSLPGDFEEVNKEVVIQTLSNNFEITLLDCDFETEPDYFVKANEIYLVQSMDTFTIQPLTQFLSDLKLKNVLDESKLRIIINKYVRLRRLDERMIIGGMSKYNEPSMTLQRDLFNAQTIKYVTIPFETETYARYLESIAMCSLSLNGYSQNLLVALEELKNMVYPLISGGNFRGNLQSDTEEKHGLFGAKKNKTTQPQTTQFSNNVNDTLNRMRTNNF